MLNLIRIKNTILRDGCKGFFAENFRMDRLFSGGLESVAAKQIFRLIPGKSSVRFRTGWLEWWISREDVERLRIRNKMGQRVNFCGKGDFFTRHSSKFCYSIAHVD